jgi:hypothetical protein
LRQPVSLSDFGKRLFRNFHRQLQPIRRFLYLAEDVAFWPSEYP